MTQNVCVCLSKETLCYSTRLWESHLADPLCLIYLLIFKYQILFVATMIDLIRDASFSLLILIVLVLFYFVFTVIGPWRRVNILFDNFKIGLLAEFFCLIGYILFVWFPEPVRKPQVIGRHVAE